jgi:hypothetical protein
MKRFLQYTAFILLAIIACTLIFSNLLHLFFFAIDDSMGKLFTWNWLIVLGLTGLCGGLLLWSMRGLGMIHFKF